MHISSVQIIPHPDPDARLKATAAVVLNGRLSLRGIKIMQGRYGLFLAYPAFTAGSPHKVFEALSMGFRRELQSEVLRAYHAEGIRTQPLPLFDPCCR